MGRTEAKGKIIKTTTERLAEITKKIAKLKIAGQCRGRRPTVLNNAVNYSESRA